jgi:hypothetical protein
MRIALIGQQDFGKAVLEAFLQRGDEVAAVFCAPEKGGAKPDVLSIAAQEKGLKLFRFESLRAPDRTIGTIGEQSGTDHGFDLEQSGTDHGFDLHLRSFAELSAVRRGTIGQWSNCSSSGSMAFRKQKSQNA